MRHVLTHSFCFSDSITHTHVPRHKHNKHTCNFHTLSLSPNPHYILPHCRFVALQLFHFFLCFQLWALLHFIMPTLFDSHEEFNEWFSKDIESHAENKSTIDESEYCYEFYSTYQYRQLHSCIFSSLWRMFLLVYVEG